ncbi:MAG: MtrB/PioB family decaheme-associated outer membrane protein [Desulfobacteraceae bacterium]|jgi:MtrB/PioB family decaheme-associated outer membrane protein
MKHWIHYGFAGLILCLLIDTVALATGAYAAETTLLNVREGLHAGYSRLVFDCRGDLPGDVGSVQGNTLSIHFSSLKVAADLKKISRRLRGEVRQIDLQQTETSSDLQLLLSVPQVRVKSFVLRSDAAPQEKYRLVIDFYMQSVTGQKEKKKIAVAPEPTRSAVTPAAAPKIASQLSSEKRQEPAASSNDGQMDEAAKSASLPAAMAASPGDGEAAKAPPEVEKNEKFASTGDTHWDYSGEASLSLRAADGEDESSTFETYRDISQPAAGSLAFEAVRNRRFHFSGGAAGIGQDDTAADFKIGYYDQYDLDFSYNRLIHRYAYDASTLYSGIGSGTITLDDTLQTNVQNAPTQVDVANLLNSAMSGAATGDPDVLREKFKLGYNLFALDPFTLKIQVGHETRKGTRPFAGAFNSLQMVEIFEPIDYETTDMKISGEYAGRHLLLNAVYHYSQFTNNIDTLTFDNPLRATDAAFGPSTGRIDLAPDNQYHNLGFTGAVTKLPWNSQITANIAFSWMLQDDTLVPFTTNSAVAAPALPQDSADAKVNTSLYHLRITSHPWSPMRIKAHLRYYNYDNQTGRIDFTGGYVETDEFLTGTAVHNLPSSYTKTRAGLDLGFDLPAQSTLGLSYAFKRTDRENREVDQQDDNILKASLDNKRLDWLTLRASVEHTDRSIGEYTYDVYRRSGDDLNELPQIRKYDQADMTRNRYQFQATAYPKETLALTGTLTFGQDDFKDSPYGLLEDNHLIASFDADYAINERATVNLFYSFETYDNSQRGNSAGSDWTADGEDRVNTYGGGVTLALMPKRLDFDLAYSYSEADGNISFSSASGSFADFSAVDDTRMHALNTKLRYHFSEKLTLSLGYLWEKFDYDDYNVDGFSSVPTDAGGNYQGALLSGTLPQDYDAHIIYTQLTFRFK